MSEYYWDTQIDYLRHSKTLFYNDDYLEFLVQSVWKIKKPVHMIDFGCGYGYLGLKLLPLLPVGSRYTGLDLGGKLLDEAKKIYSQLPYPTQFVQADIQDFRPEQKYDLAVCHAFLLHVPNPLEILRKMKDCLVDFGKIIAFEPHWISNAANAYLHGCESSEWTQLGFLQKLYEQDAKKSGKDGNVGMKLPVYLSQLGLKDVQCRVSDKVNVLHPFMDSHDKKQLYTMLKESRYADEPGVQEAFIKQLMERGATESEAMTQYDNERFLANKLTMEAYFAYAPTMKISFGEVRRS